MCTRATWLVLCCILASVPADAGLDAREIHVRRLLGEGKYHEGYRSIVETVGQAPDGNRFYRLLAEAAEYAGKAHEADSILTACARRGRDVPSALSALAWLDVHGGRWQEACEHFKASVSIGGPTTVALAGIQEMEERLHGGDAAIAHLLAMSHVHENASPVWYALALAYWGQWDLARAKFAVERSLRSGAIDSRVRNLQQAIASAQNPGPRSRGRTAAAIADARERGDWEGLAFLHWVQMNAFDAAGLPDSAAIVRAAGLKDAKAVGLVGWVGQFYLQAGRVAVARGNIADAIASADSAAGCFSIAGEFDGTLAAYSLRMTILLESSRYPEALELCFRTLQQLDGRADPRLHAGAAIDAAWILSQIGGQRIALALGVEAESILEKLFYAAHDRCRLNFVLARVHISLGELETASRYARTGLQIAAEQTGDRLLLANAEGVLGDIERVSGKLAAARQHYSRQWNLASRLAHPGEKKAAALALARTATRARRTRDAMQWIDTAFALSRSAGDRIGEGECHLLRGTLAELNGHLMDARQDYAAARLCLSSLRRLRSASSLTREMRDWYIDQHARLASGLLRTGDVRGSAAVMALARLDVHPGLEWHEDGFARGAKDPHSGIEVGRREASCMIHRRVLRGRDVSAGSSDSTVHALSLFFTQIMPQYIREDENCPGIPSASALQSELLASLSGSIAPGEVAIEFLFGETNTDVIVMSHDTILADGIPAGVGAFNDLANEEYGAGESLVSQRTPGGSSGLRPVIASFLRRAMRERKRCVVLGTGLQTCIPFEECADEAFPSAALSAGAMTFRHVPSLLGFRRSRAPARGIEKILVVGDPCTRVDPAGPDEGIVDPGRTKRVSSMLETLPGTGTEISMIEQLFGSRVHILKDMDATPENLRALAPGCAVVHIAVHGNARVGEGTDHALFLSGPDLNSGALRIEDVLSMDLHASLVVLPACYSGRPGRNGDVESFAEAFLEAGAASVLAVRGAVDDERTAEYIGEFYSALARGESLTGATEGAAAALVERGHLHSAAGTGFLLFGEGGAVALRPGSGKGDDRWWLVLLAISMMVSTALWFAWKKIRHRH